METILQDLRFAFRSLRKQRSTSTIAILCLALGIGANTAIFTVVRTVLHDSHPYRGRTFAPGEDQAGHNVVVLSEGFFRRRFAADPKLIGKQISLNNTPFTVIGVMGADFDYPISPTHSDAWVPLVFTKQNLEQRGAHWLQVVGRLKPGLDSLSANARLKPLGER